MGPMFRISAIALDPRIRGSLSPAQIAECDIAIRDLLLENTFQPVGSPGGPYQLSISLEDSHLVLQLFLEDNTPHGTAILSATPYRRKVAQYVRLCEALASAHGEARLPDQIEAIDMARRAVHNAGAELLMERLSGKVVMDTTTARGLFTLICEILRVR